MESDDVVLGVSAAIRLTINLWIAYGKGRHNRYLSISETAALLANINQKHCCISCICRK